jgi:hypothetical protein
MLLHGNYALRSQFLRRAMFRRIQIALAAGSILLFTSGCMKADMDLTVNQNDTVSGSVIIAFSNDAINLANSLGSSSALNTDSLIQEQPGITSVPFKDADYEGTKISFENRPFSEFATGTAADSLKFTRDGDIVSVTGAIDMAGEDPTAIDQIRTNPITSGLFAKSDISVSITMPGKILESSGNVVGNTVTFSGELGDNIVIDVKADTSSGINPIGLGIGAVVVAGAVAAGIVVMNRRKAAAQPQASSQGQFTDWE